MRGNADGHENQQEVEPGEQGAAQLADDGEVFLGGRAAGFGRDGFGTRWGIRRPAGRQQSGSGVRGASRASSAQRPVDERAGTVSAGRLGRTGGSSSNAVCFLNPISFLVNSSARSRDMKPDNSRITVIEYQKL